MMMMLPVTFLLGWYLSFPPLFSNFLLYFLFIYLERINWVGFFKPTEVKNLL